MSCLLQHGKLNGLADGNVIRVQSIGFRHFRVFVCYSGGGGTGFRSFAGWRLSNLGTLRGRGTPFQLGGKGSDVLELHYLDFVYHPLRESRGTITGVFVLEIDVTERKRAEQVLMQSEKLNAVGRLASSIAHEINNPLESVTNLIYLAQRATENADTRQYLQDAEVELRRVSAMGSQTLRFNQQTTQARLVTTKKLVDITLPLHQGRLVNSKSNCGSP